MNKFLILDDLTPSKPEDLDKMKKWYSKYDKFVTQEMRDDDVYSSHYEFYAEGTKKPYEVVYLNDSPLRKAERKLAGISELVKCKRCNTYHDDPEHWCGSVALVPQKDIPITWWYHCRPAWMWPHMNGLKDG